MQPGMCWQRSNSLSAGKEPRCAALADSVYILHWGLFQVANVMSLNGKRWEETRRLQHSLTQPPSTHTLPHGKPHVHTLKHRLHPDTPSQHRDTGFSVKARRHMRAHTCAYRLGGGDTYACTCSLAC